MPADRKIALVAARFFAAAFDAGASFAVVASAAAGELAPAFVAAAAFPAHAAASNTAVASVGLMRSLHYVAASVRRIELVP